jgi:NDP-sugar pyrophosphorylase family protein
MLKIVVPMGGEARRFAEHGYTFPKPLVEIDGRPMIEVVLANLRPSEEHQFVFICKQEHIRDFALAEVLQQIAPGCRVVAMPAPTAGALCSVLLGLQEEDRDQELLVANADQVVEMSIDEFLAQSRAPGVDGAIVTFPSTHPKWSYVLVEGGQVVAAAEKRPISPDATVGLYYFREVRHFVEAAENMLVKNASLHNEFYVCPVYNEYVLAGRRVVTYPIGRQAMHSLGTPEDVERYAALLAHRSLQSTT